MPYATVDNPDAEIEAKLESGFSICKLSKDLDSLFGPALFVAFAAHIGIGSLTTFCATGVLFNPESPTTQSLAFFYMSIALTYGNLS